MSLSLKDFEAAEGRLHGIIHNTELSLSSTFSKMAGGEIYLKCENQQNTGSFKIRGAANKIACLMSRGERKRIYASSAGNHAQGVAFAATSNGYASTIVMPETAPLAKIQATEGYGATVVLHGDGYDSAQSEAQRLCREDDGIFLHAFNDLEVIAGQGTVALEILRALPTVDTIVVPVGGGGFISGISCCAKLINPRVKIIGVQAAEVNPIARSFKEKKLVTADRNSTIADGIAVKCPGDISMEFIWQYCDDIVTVSDNEISAAMLLLMERSKQIVEPAGAASLAAVLSKKIDANKSRTVCVLSGGNIDVGFIPKIIEQGLVSRHRRLKFSTTVSDTPGTLMRVLQIVAENGANILSIGHDRHCPDILPSEIMLHIACEVGGKSHAEKLIASLCNYGYVINLE